MMYRKAQRDDVFITSIWRKRITGFSTLNESIMKEFQNEDSENSHKNIYGGQEVRLKAGPGIKLLLDCAEALAKEIADSLRVVGADNPRVTCFWGNINKEKEFNPPHVHPASDLSGAYYVQVPENEITNDDQLSTAGSICFHDPKLQKTMSSPLHAEELAYLELNEYSQPKDFPNRNPWADNIVKYKPEEGLMLMWPSWLLHYVEPNLSKESRVALSFNIRFR